jgi:hypothetical protein
MVNGGSEGLVSFAEYARYRGVSRAAVSKALSRGRIKNAVRVVDGRQLVDVGLADQEWAANTGRPRLPATEPSPGPREAWRYAVVRTREYVVIQEIASSAVHSVKAPDSFIDSAHSATSLDAEEITDVMTPETARRLAALLIEKAAARADVDDLPVLQHKNAGV